MKKFPQVLVNVRVKEKKELSSLPRVKAKIEEALKKKFPDDPNEQLWGGIGAVFQSWNGRRAVSYRRIEGIPDAWGTAVSVQAMVFGNMGDHSATGVAFTRNPATGDDIFYGEWLVNAQGEDVVAGIRTPKPISELGKQMPDVYKKLAKITSRLEKHYRDIQDFEFTVEDGKLYMLQTRVGKRTGLAAIRIAVDRSQRNLYPKRRRS
jgi:pyruvate,orthophosphate dikinase